MKRLGISPYERCSITYKTSNDYVILNEEELKSSLLNLVGKSLKQNFTNYYGSSEDVIFTVHSVEKKDWKFVVTISCNTNVPERFYPTLFEIAKPYGLMAPISCEIL